ncbi:MAG: GvpL/GvpF family gas vesicle protein [Acidobacteria bacterium]|nr:GvpL/GvpF family gas vesicle protein [Acidobacteriota bacterium]
MAWYAYCLAEQQAFLPGSRSRRPTLIEDLRGISQQEVYAYPSGDFVVIVSEAAGGEFDQQAVLQHARVVSECFRATTVLPFRFGTVFHDDEELRRAVRANRKAFTATVERLRGKSEMHLKLLVRDGVVTAIAPESGTVRATAGGEYLVQLKQRAARDRERQSRARTLSVQVQRLFNPLEADVTCKKVDSGRIMIDIAHLIPSHGVEKYQNRYNIAARQLKGCELMVSGPWPPYHFMPGKLRTVS